MIFIPLILAVSLYGFEQTNTNGMLKYNELDKEIGQYLNEQKPKYQMFNVTFSSASLDNNQHPTKVQFVFLATNWYKKEIRAFRGTVTVKNIFGDVIKSIPLTYQKSIRAREGMDMGAMSLIQTDTKIDRLVLENLSVIIINSEDYVKDHKSVWKTDKIIFMDGSEKVWDEFLPIDWKLSK